LPCLLVPLALATVGSAPAAVESSARLSADRPSDAQEIRSIWTDEVGVSRPAGLSYLPDEGSLVVAQREGNQTKLVRLGMYEDRLGALRLPAVSHPATLAFNGASDGLTVVDGSEIVTVAAADVRKEKPPVRRASVAALGLQDPQGATLDPVADAWLVLDNGARAIVRVPVGSGGASSERVSLQGLGASRLQGLALNPEDGLLYVAKPKDNLLYGLDGSGSVQKVYRLGGLALRDLQAIVFAPSADPTDDPATQHLYIADAGGPSTMGRVVEATLSATAITAAALVIATHIQTIDTSQYTPPSPDPAGVVYAAASDRFIVSDSEVDEMAIYQGANLYEGTRTGGGIGTGTTVAWSQEPSGLGLNPANNTLFVSDDDRDKVFIDRPGADGRHGTADDSVTSLSTSTFGSSDAEDVEYDTESGHLFVSDGVGIEVYDIDPVNGVFGDGNDVVTNFDVAQYGSRDAEGIGIDPQRHTLLVVDPSTKTIYELTRGGALVRTIDAHGIPTTNRLYADVTMAPSSDPTDPPAKLNYWIVDRQVDNGADPNENDGKLYEISVPSDDALPTVTLATPAEGATVSGTIVVEASAADDVGVTQVAFSVDGTSIGTDTDGADGWSVSWDTTGVAEGARTVTATATDTVGQTASDSNGVTVDNDANAPPTVTLTAPAEGATVSGTVLVQASATDDVGVTQVAFSVDGTSIGTDTDGADGWSASWDTTGVAEGAHTVTAAATDTVGQTASDSTGVTVDNVDAPPTVTLTAPAEGARVAGTVLAQATASDDNGVTQVQFSLDGNPIGTDTHGADGWSVSWDTTTAADGAHTLTATARDTSEQTTSDSNGVTVDNEPPVVAVTSPVEGATVSATISVEATATDNQSVASVQFRVDGASIGTDTNGANGWSVSWDTTTVADGSHSVTAVASDGAGNTTTSAPVLVAVDNPDIVVRDVPVAVGVDDADELQNGTVRRTNGDLELGSDKSTPTTVGLRFTGVDVPQGATLTRAYVQFQVDEKGTTAASLTVRGESSDNAAGFATAAFGISSRPRTTASVGWTPPAWSVIGAAGPDQRPPDLSSVLQEIVNRPGWSAGNALVLLVTGSGRRTAESFEGGAPPILHLEYVRP
jgi:Bacterial Ig domain